MRLVAGIDPGITGAVGVVDHNGELLTVYDLPMLEERHGKKSRKVLDVLQFRDGLEVLCLMGDLEIWIEEVGAMPGQGVTSTFRFGQLYGMLCATTLVLSRPVRVEFVKPAAWKRQMGLNRAKGLSRTKAIRRWPSRRGRFERVRDDGRAEAALIALYGLRHG